MSLRMFWNRWFGNSGRWQRIGGDVRFGKNVRLGDFVNLYGCRVGDETSIGPFVEIQKNADIGARCKIQSHTFICEGVTIEDEAFIGHGVIFINDRHPAAVTVEGQRKNETDWKLEKTLVKKRASIGSGAVILCGVTIGEEAVVGAGAVVTKNVPPKATVAGVPARLVPAKPIWT